MYTTPHIFEPTYGQGMQSSRLLLSQVLKREDCALTPYPTLPYPTLPYPTLPYPSLPYPTLPYPTQPYHDSSQVLFSVGANNTKRIGARSAMERETTRELFLFPINLFLSTLAPRRFAQLRQLCSPFCTRGLLLLLNL